LPRIRITGQLSVWDVKTERFKKGGITMGKKRIISICLTIFVVGMTAFTVGCATTGPQRQTKATSSMGDTKDELVLTTAQVRATMASLNSLVGQSGNDLRKQYDQFVKEVKSTDKQTKKMREHVDKMNAQSGAYFDSWEQDLETIQNPDIRKRSEERRAKAFDSYKKIDTAMQSANEGLDPFLSDLKDIQRYLGNDLTAQGIAAISEVVKKADANATTVLERLDAVIAEVDRVAAEMSASKGEQSQ
jgi:septation ring formation regulator EzrA